MSGATSTQQQSFEHLLAEVDAVLKGDPIPSHSATSDLQLPQLDIPKLLFSRMALSPMAEVVQTREALLFERPTNTRQLTELMVSSLEEGKTAGIPVKAYIEPALDALERVATGDSALLSFLHGVAAEGFEEWLAAGARELSDPIGWWLDELKNELGAVPQIRIPPDVAVDIRRYAAAVAESLSHNDEFTQALKALSDTKDKTNHTANSGARKIAGVMLILDQLFSESAVSTAFFRYSQKYPEREMAVEYRGLVLLALDHVKQYFCSSLLNQILKNAGNVVTQRGLATLSAVVNKPHGLPTDTYAQNHWHEHAAYVKEQLQEILPSRTRISFACHHNQQILDLSDYMRSNPVTPTPPVSDHVRPNTLVAIAKEIRKDQPLTMTVTTSPNIREEVFAISAPQRAPGGDAVSVGKLLTMTRENGKFAMMPTDFFVPVHEDELVGVPTGTLDSYLENTINGLQHQAIEVWQALPQLFSQLEYLSMITLVVGEDTVGIGCLLSERDAVLGHIKSDISLDDTQVQEVHIVAEGVPEKMVRLTVPRSCLSDDFEVTKSTTEATSAEAEAERDLASKNAQKFSNYEKFEKFLRDEWGVTVDKEGGKGSHLMLYRKGRGWPIGGRIYNEDVPLVKSVVLKTLKALGISYAEFNQLMHKIRSS